MAPYPDRGLLKAEIVARVASGETVKDICAEPGLPTAACVQVWRRELMFDEAVAAAFLTRVAAGERISDLLARPGMPSQGAYRYWRRTQPQFQAALVRLRAGGYSQRSATGHPRWRAWDEAVADRLLAAVLKGAPMRATLATDPAFPSLAVLARWRAEQPDWDAALQIAMRLGRDRRRAAACRAWAEVLADEVGVRVLEGASLRTLGTAAADLPCARTLYAWRKRWPSFDDAIRLAKEMRDERVAEARFEAVWPGGLAALFGGGGFRRD